MAEEGAQAGFSQAFSRWISKVGCMKGILGNPAMIQAYRDGIPANGTAVPDGAALAKIEWLQDRDERPYGVTVS